MSSRTWLALALSLALAVLCVEQLAFGEVRARATATQAKPPRAAARVDGERGTSLSSPCGIAPGLPTAPVGIAAKRGYKLAKNWDFTAQIRDEAKLRSEFQTRYIYANGTLDHLNDEWTRYRDNDNHVFSTDGLSLVARVKGALAPAGLESGMLRSRWSGRYGVFEICMRAPAGRGLWPAFWLNPEDGRWPPEIDVVEIVNDHGSVPDRSFHFLHGKGESAETPRVSLLDRWGAYPGKVDYSREFHAFSVEWTSTRVRHLVDGVVVADRAFRWVHDDGSDAGGAHVLVNLAAGGAWAGPPTEGAVFPASLLIAFMRVWQ